MLEINKTFLLGNLTRDPDVRYLPSGTMVSEFDLAVNRTYKDKNGEQKQETLFIRIESMGKLAEFVSEYLKKGRRVYVEGRLRKDSWESKEGQKRSRIVLHSDRIQFADPRPSSQEQNREAVASSKSSEQEEGESDDDELPTIDIGNDESSTENNMPF